jgi:hypothetical protein
MEAANNDLAPIALQAVRALLGRSQPRRDWDRFVNDHNSTVLLGSTKLEAEVCVLSDSRLCALMA